MEQVTIYREPGKFAGWPANYGMWAWGDELVVGFTVSSFKVDGRFHARDTSKPTTTMQAMVPGQPALARIEIQKFAHVFRKGSRIRLWIDTPSQFGGNLFAPQSVPTRLDVVHDAAHPSRLVLGEAPASAVVGAIPVARPACSSVVHQPCRPDPQAAGITPLGLPVSEGAN